MEVDSFNELNGGHLLKCVEVENFEELKGDLNYLDMYLCTSSIKTSALFMAAVEVPNIILTAQTYDKS